MKNVLINGKEYPVKFSFAALDNLCDLKGCSFSELEELFDVDKIRPADVVLLSYVGLKEGARRSGQNFKMEIDDVDDLLMSDMSAISRILGVFNSQNAAPEGNPAAPAKGATKGKKTPSRKK